MTSTALRPFAFACFGRAEKILAAGAVRFLLCVFIRVPEQAGRCLPGLSAGVGVVRKDGRTQDDRHFVAAGANGGWPVVFFLFRHHVLPYGATIPYFGAGQFPDDRDSLARDGLLQ